MTETPPTLHREWSFSKKSWATNSNEIKQGYGECNMLKTQIYSHRCMGTLAWSDPCWTPTEAWLWWFTMRRTFKWEPQPSWGKHTQHPSREERKNGQGGGGERKTWKHGWYSRDVLMRASQWSQRLFVPQQNVKQPRSCLDWVREVKIMSGIREHDSVTPRAHSATRQHGEGSDRSIYYRHSHRYREAMWTTMEETFCLRSVSKSTTQKSCCPLRLLMYNCKYETELYPNNVWQCNRFSQSFWYISLIHLNICICKYYIT